MAEILSAAELDALLTERRVESAAGAPAPSGATHHSFAAPPSLPQAGLERLSTLASSFAERMKTRLASELRREVGVTLGRVELLGRADAEQVLQGAVHLCFESGDGDREADFLLDTATALALVEARLGGTIAESQPRRPLTPVEAPLLKRLLGTCAGPALGSCFGRLGAPVPECRAAAGMLPGSGFLALQMQVSVEGRGGPAVLLLPAAKVQELSSASPTPPPPRRRGMQAALLGRLPVRVVPRIAGGMISLSDLMQLSPGQVVRLDHPEQEPLEILCNGRPVLTGRLIRVGPTPALEIGGWRSKRAAREEAS